MIKIRKGQVWQDAEGHSLEVYRLKTSRRGVPMVHCNTLGSNRKRSIPESKFEFMVLSMQCSGVDTDPEYMKEELQDYPDLRDYLNTQYPDWQFEPECFVRMCVDIWKAAFKSFESFG